jgi:hypothetical protein
MKLRFLTTALVALASGALLTQSAQAAFTPGGQAAAGDLILAFQASSGTGSTLNYEVDLGSIASFTSGTSSIDLSADLSSTYGAGWFNDTSLTWAVVGTANNGTIPTSIGTIKNGSVLASTTSTIAAESKNQLSGSISAINALYNPATGTVGTDGTSLTILTSDPSSFNATTSGTGSYGFLGPINGSFAASGTTPVTLSLDLLQPGTGNTAPGTSTTVGGFSLGSNGTLSYSAAAVPEPSTYALMVGGLLFLWQLNRRKSGSTI